MEQEQPQNQQPENMVMFSKTAYSVLKNIILWPKNFHWVTFFATSTIPFQTWMTPTSFLYFCLTTSRCADCTRIFLNSNTIEQIKNSDETLYAATILQAHEIFNLRTHFFTYDQVYNFLNESQTTTWPTRCKSLYRTKLTKEAIQDFIKNPKYLDFGLLESANQAVLLLPIKQNGIMNIEVITQKTNLCECFNRLVYEANLSPFSIVCKPEIVLTYRRLKETLEIGKEITPAGDVRSDYFLN
ncbi:MAG: hypothetical protein WC496_02305 [Phycisphaerae bacterium]|jgi:hypothetical protein